MSYEEDIPVVRCRSSNPERLKQLNCLVYEYSIYIFYSYFVDVTKYE